MLKNTIFIIGSFVISCIFVMPIALIPFIGKILLIIILMEELFRLVMMAREFADYGEVNKLHLIPIVWILKT